jgi:hypothetical protein
MRLHPFRATFLLAASLLFVRPAFSQIAVVSVRSVEDLLANARELATLSREQERFQTVEAFLHLQTKDLDGVDRQRPLGVYMVWPEKNGAPAFEHPEEILVVPIVEEKRFLDLLERLQGKPRKEGLRYRVTLPGFPEYFFRFAHRCVYASTRADLLEGKLPDPATLWPARASMHSVTATIHVNQFPAGWVAALDRIAQTFQGSIPGPVGQVPQPTGTVAAPLPRRSLNKLGNDFSEALGTEVADLATQTHEITLDLDLDRKQHQLTLNLIVLPGSHTNLEAVIASFARARSVFGYLAQPGVFVFYKHFPPPRDLRETGLARLLPNIARSLFGIEENEVVRKVTDILYTTMDQDGLDVCLVGRPERLMTGDGVPGFLGVKVRKGRQIDHLLRDLVKDLPAAERKQLTVRWNVDRHAGARIHHFQQEGSEPFDLTIREDVLFLSKGSEGLRVVKEALDGFGKSPPAPTPAVRLSWPPEQSARKVGLATTGFDPNGDFVQMTVQGGKDLHLHLGVDLRQLPYLVDKVKTGGK